jgi:hypothetical protein
MCTAGIAALVVKEALFAGNLDEALDLRTAKESPAVRSKTSLGQPTVSKPVPHRHRLAMQRSRQDPDLEKLLTRTAWEIAGVTQPHRSVIISTRQRDPIGCRPARDPIVGRRRPRWLSGSSVARNHSRTVGILALAELRKRPRENHLDEWVSAHETNDRTNPRSRVNAPLRARDRGGFPDNRALVPHVRVAFKYRGAGPFSVRALPTPRDIEPFVQPGPGVPPGSGLNGRGPFSEAVHGAGKQRFGAGLLVTHAGEGGRAGGWFGPPE